MKTMIPQKFFRDEDEWVEHGRKLAQTEQGIERLIGAWWNAGKSYGYRVDRAKECGFRLATCRQYGRVVDNVGR